MNLPEIIQLSSYSSQTDFIHAILKIFNSDFFDIDNLPRFNNQNIFLKRRPNGELNGINYDWSFHHIITKEDSIASTRIFDQDRAERICFPRFFIDNYTKLILWKKPDKGDRSKYYICDNNFDYVVILSERKNYIMLLTAFPLGRSYKQKMKNDYEKFKKL